MTTIEERKFRRNCIGIVLLLAAFYVAGDWIVYLRNAHKQAIPAAFLIAVAAAKFCVTTISFILVWNIDEDCIDRKDRFLQRLSFAFIMCADFCMVLLNPVLLALGIKTGDGIMTLGILFFMVVQTCLIVRHSRNTLSMYRSDRHSLAGHVAIEVLLLLVTAIPAAGIIYLSTHKTNVIFMIYAFYLIISLYVAWGTIRRRFFPKKNAWMIAIGMTCFFLCDLNIGLSTLSPLMNTFVWVFYTPALLLLALSGVKPEPENL